MYPEAKCPAALPRLVKPFPSPRALRLRNTFQALFCCHTRRLLIQSGWRGVSLQIRPPVLKELLLHAAPYVRWDWLPCLSTQDIFFSPLSSLYLITPPSHLPYLLVPLLTIWITYLFFPPPRSPNASHPGYLPQMLRQIPPLSNNGGAEIRSPPSFHLLPEQSLTSALYSDFQKTWERNCRACSCARPPLCVLQAAFFFSFFAQVTPQHAWEGRLMEVTSDRNVSDMKVHVRRVCEHGGKHEVLFRKMGGSLLLLVF